MTLGIFSIGVGNEFQTPFDPRSFPTCAHFPGNLGTSESLLVPCDEPTKGRYVSIYMSRHELLALAEVEVFGTVVAGNYNPHFRLNLQTSQAILFLPF